MGARPGERHIEQPPLLLKAPHPTRLLEQGDRLCEAPVVAGVAERPCGETVAIESKFMRELTHAIEPCRVAVVGGARRRHSHRGKLPVVQSRYGNDVPLKPLRGVDRQHLDGAWVGLSHGCIESVFFRPRRIEPRKEGTEGRAFGSHREGASRIDKCINCPPLRSVRPRYRGLNVEPPGALREEHELVEREIRVASDRVNHGGE